jgi:hemerythrin-like domain-containing protein
MESIEKLLEEHRVIERGLGILESISSEKIDKNKLENMLKFLKVFVDKCHHGKEERFLFPRLEERGLNLRAGPIAVMLAEHEQMRNLIAEIEKEVQNQKADEEKIKSMIENYVYALRMHKLKEESVLFKIAEQILDENDDKELSELFEKFEEEEIGKGIHQKFHKMIEELEKEV